MKNLCGFSVFHCVEGAFGASSGATPKMKNGAPRDEPKNGRGRGWVVPNSTPPKGAIPFGYLASHRHTCAIPMLQHIARLLCDTSEKLRAVRVQSGFGVDFSL